jgi:hypothetical protein
VFCSRFGPQLLQQRLLPGRKSLHREHGYVSMLGKHPGKSRFGLQDDQAGKQRESSRFDHKN